MVASSCKWLLMVDKQTNEHKSGKSECLTPVMTMSSAWGWDFQEKFSFSVIISSSFFSWMCSSKVVSYIMTAWDVPGKNNLALHWAHFKPFSLSPSAGESICLSVISNFMAMEAIKFWIIIFFLKQIKQIPVIQLLY